jgi:hypothetical protein
MPRKTTRTQNRSRPNRKNIERRIDDAADGDAAELPPLTVSEALNFTVETVAPGVLEIQETGELRRGDDDGGEE